MSKLTKEQKLEIYNKRKEGYPISSLAKEYGVLASNIKYLVRLIDYHGIALLEKRERRYYSPALKEKIINEVLLDNNSVGSTAIKYGLASKGVLFNWIKSYRNNCYTIVEKARGRPTIMKKEKTITKSFEEMSDEEKLKHLENENTYLKAENEYLKKLRAVVQEREDQRLKKK